ncbi:hypothetical protein QYM36_017323 [Artemia franciscana]|uniref:Endonuclease/exonuclease/phosphatase domain-containing protein n=1 Tax=Artemia franciscana TaxID=6661 RepID=A0AA88KVL9_ARTSF|nr:hypothetical protein QYM36_017323 [Artemia franciscana]
MIKKYGSHFLANVNEVKDAKAKLWEMCALNEDCLVRKSTNAISYHLSEIISFVIARDKCVDPVPTFVTRLPTELPYILATAYSLLFVKINQLHQTVVEIETKEEFYHTLQVMVNSILKHDIMCVLGDLNAVVGNDKSYCRQALGSHGMGVRTRMERC